MIGAEEAEKGGRVYVVVNHRRICPVSNVLQTNAPRPTIAFKSELPLYGCVQREEIRKAELPRPGNNLAKLVNGCK